MAHARNIAQVIAAEGSDADIAEFIKRFDVFSEDELFWQQRLRGKMGYSEI